MGPHVGPIFFFTYPSRVKIASTAEMHELGKQIGTRCRAGDLILLNGPLGAGKTVLVQGIGHALGIADVTSPTFVISRIHQATLPLIHIDVYRLLDGGNAAAYLDDLDIDTPRESAVTVIEWGGAESARLSDERLEITIDRSDEIRDVEITAIGDRWKGFSL
jgi:tRNA threonylcarbamoyladenosine biosynthesis protein TsaE